MCVQSVTMYIAILNLQGTSPTECCIKSYLQICPPYLPLVLVGIEDESNID